MLINTSSSKSFASDNHAGIHPTILAAITAANTGDAPAYGEDSWTAVFNERVQDTFGPTAAGFPVFNGAGANLVSLALMLGRYDAIICTTDAHIATHETGAVERLLGTKLILAPAPDGKLRPQDIINHLDVLGNAHEPQPKVVSISQVTELGTTYSPAETAALATIAHDSGLYLHMDGARLANAAAFLNCDLRTVTTDAGVDVLSFGGTKNGALAAEAVIVLNPDLRHGVPFLRRQSLQLASKTRFISAQLTALLTRDLWRENAKHANAMSQRLGEGLAEIPGVEIALPVQSNAVFARIPARAVEELLHHHRFHYWNRQEDLVRLMTAFDTTPEHVDTFLEDTRRSIKP